MRPGLKEVSGDVRAKVPQPYRELLHRYTIMLNMERHRRGQPPIRPAEVAGAMICFILDTHQQSIIDGYEALRTNEFAKKFNTFLGGACPEASSPTGAAEVPDPRGAPGT